MKGLSRLGLRSAAAAALARPPNCALTAVSVWVGALASGHPHATAGVAAAAAAAAAVAAAGNGLNDVLDLPADRVNRPDRPLPSGRLSPAAALVLSATLGAAGLGTAFVVGLAPGVIAFAVAAGLALYNWWWKRLGLAGNLLVGLLAAATFPYGAVAAGGGGRWWVPAAFALVYHLGREILKGAEDVEGDRVHGVRTFAGVHGTRTAARVAAALLAVTALAAPLPGAPGDLRLGLPGSRGRSGPVPGQDLRRPLARESVRGKAEPPAASGDGPRPGRRRPRRARRPRRGTVRAAPCHRRVRLRPFST